MIESYDVLMRKIEKEKTKAEAMEAALVNLQALFTAFINSIPLAVFIKDAKLRYSHVNKAQAELMGLPAEHILGQDERDCFPGEVGEDRFDKEREILNSRQAYGDIEQFYGPEGISYVQSVRFPVFDGKGEVLGLGGFAEDVTKHIETSRKLAEAQERIRIVLDCSPVGLLCISQDGVITLCEGKGFQDMGLSHSEIVGELATEVFADYGDIVTGIVSGLQGRPSSQMVTVNNKIFEVMFVPLDTNGENTLIVCANNVTERQRVEDALEQVARWNEQILNTAAEGILGLDENGSVSFINPEAEKLLGRSRYEVVGRALNEVLVHSTKEGVVFNEQNSPILAALREGAQCHHTEELFWRPNEESFIAEYRVAPIMDDETIVGAVMTFKDITETVQVREELRAMAMVDELTGLYNKRGFLIKAQQQLLQAERVSKDVVIFYVDLDDLKGINDIFGHQTGDQALKDTAEIMRLSFRGDDIIGRLGGDEFAACVVTNSADATAEAIEARLFNMLASHNSKRHYYGMLSFSVGSSGGKAGKKVPLAKLMQEADERMYEQKSNKVVFRRSSR